MTVGLDTTNFSTPNLNLLRIFDHHLTYKSFNMGGAVSVEASRNPPDPVESLKQRAKEMMVKNYPDFYYQNNLDKEIKTAHVSPIQSPKELTFRSIDEEPYNTEFEEFRKLAQENKLSLEDAKKFVEVDSNCLIARDAVSYRYAYQNAFNNGNIEVGEYLEREKVLKIRKMNEKAFLDLFAFRGHREEVPLVNPLPSIKTL
jgi:hypothetical protein